jgi:hypothetical protein
MKSKKILIVTLTAIWLLTIAAIVTLNLTKP